MRIPFYGVLLAPTIVLAIYGGQHASPYDLIRPLVVSVLVGCAAFLMVGTLTKRWHAAAFAVAMAVVAVAGVQFLALALAWPILALLSSRRGHGWGVLPRLTQPLNAFVTTWFAIALIGAVAATIPTRSLSFPPLQVATGANVYLIWLDGYPRADTLREYFGFDNSEFQRDLESRGFTVSQDSETDYPSTIQTLATLLESRPLHELLEDDWNGTNDQHRELWHAIQDAQLPRAYEAAGYTTYSIVSPAPGHDWRTADVVLDSPWLSDFEAHLFTGGVLRPFIPFWAMHRADILDTFDYLERSAGTSPRFVLAHILKPHDPYVFAADGGPAEPCGASCTNHAGPPNAMLGDRLTGQITWLNRRVLQAVDHVTSVDPNGVIVIFSDHGLRRDRNDMDEWFRTLFAARGGAFPDNVVTSDLGDYLISQAAQRPDSGDVGE
jgi:hypothetical protein